jgi:hypothetical protein
MPLNKKTYLIRLRDPSGALQRVEAVDCEIYREHLVFLTADRKLAAMFLMELVESFNVIATSS